MIQSKNLSKKNIVTWLLEEENQTIRYFTLRDLLDKKEDDLELNAAKSAIPNSKVITKIFSKQKPEGYWEETASPYLPKYKSSYWTIMILAQMGIDQTDQRVKKACEYIFRFQHEESGFLSETEKTAKRRYDWHLKRGKKMPPFKEWASSLIREQQLSCLTGNMAAALIRLGYENDPRVKKALNWLVKIQNQDGGWLCPYWKAHIKDTHGCFFGTICPIEAFSEVPKENLTEEMKNTISRGAEFLLMHRLFKADHHNYKTIKQSWLKFCLPRFYSYDILRGLNVLTKLGYTNDERLNDALDILLKKRQKDRTWILENSPTGRMQTNIEPVGRPSKWITLFALRVLKRLNKLTCEDLNR
ncbi:MAG: prenyltransferase/squalene oxidase repeat-containing protein [bacterium]